MKISEDQLKKVQERLSDRTFWKEPPCPACSSNEWGLNDTVFELREFNLGAFIVAGPLLPVLPLTCTKCGYTLFFNAIVMGLVERREKSPELEESKK